MFSECAVVRFDHTVSGNLSLLEGGGGASVMNSFIASTSYHLLDCARSCTLFLHAVALVVQDLPDVYVEKMLAFLAERVDNSAHLEFYLRWCTLLLTSHGTKIKQNASSLMASLRDLQKSIVQKQAELGKMYVRMKSHFCRAAGLTC